MNIVSFLLMLSLLINFTNEQALDAIVMPFHKKQLNKLLFNLESWNTFHPTKSAKQVELIIFNSGPTDLDLEKTIMKFFQQNPSVATNFSNITVQFAQLRTYKDSYFRGTRTMFEYLLFSLDPIDARTKSTLRYSNQNISYVFYMEPDCLPIKRNWLDALHEEIRRLDGKFWMLGSRFAGELRWFGNQKDDFLNHLNGNSIYNIRSKEFRQFYRDEVTPNYPKGEFVPYDLKIPQMLYKNKRALFNKFGSMFVPTKVIVNTGGSKMLRARKHKMAFLQHICDNWDDYWRFYESILPSSNQKLLERLKALIIKK